MAPGVHLPLGGTGAGCYRETVVDLSLGSTSAGTRLVLSQGPFLTDERLELHRNGWTEWFEKLQAVLGSGT